MAIIRHTKVGVDAIAVEEFDIADTDGSGELSVIEIFCLLPKIEKRMMTELRALNENEYESDSGNLFFRRIYSNV